MKRESIHCFGVAGGLFISMFLPEFSATGRPSTRRFVFAFRAPSVSPSQRE